jgi:hypothetical protein
MPAAGVASGGPGFTSAVVTAMVANAMVDSVPETRSARTANVAIIDACFSITRLIADESQRLALDQQDVGGAQGAAAHGARLSVDQRRDLAARAFGIT